MDAERRYYSIGEMCDEFGVTARALRFYEDEGLIAPERRGHARLYSERDRARLAWILRGKRVGFSLAEIREMLDLYDRRRPAAARSAVDHRALPRTHRRCSSARASTSTPRSTNSRVRRACSNERLDQGSLICPIYTAPVRDTRFILDHVVGLGRYANLPGFAERLARHRRGGARRGRQVRRRSAVRRSTASATRKAAPATTTASVTTPDRVQGSVRAVRAKAAGRRCPRPRNLAGRRCRMWSRPRSANMCCRPTRRSRCIRG